MLWEHEPQASVSTAFSKNKTITSTDRTSSVFLSSFSINLLAFYREGRSLIGYATHYLFCDR